MLNFPYFFLIVIGITLVYLPWLESSLSRRAKKVVFNSLGLMDFAIGLVNSVLNLPNRQVKFFEEFKL